MVRTEQGMFEMSFICSVQSMTLSLARTTCLERIDACSDASLENRMKARSAVEACTSIKNLMILLTNFNLAHQGLYVGTARSRRMRS
jgi:hypothetical protein